ncbi:hypothetical protein GW17_00005243 [Ensete ventricosum]|nr:hypothetical protein GW17_00005243 [Ensete ventricosum]
MPRSLSVGSLISLSETGSKMPRGGFYAVGRLLPAQPAQNHRNSGRAAATSLFDGRAEDVTVVAPPHLRTCAALHPQQGQQHVLLPLPTEAPHPRPQWKQARHITTTVRTNSTQALPPVLHRHVHASVCFSEDELAAGEKGTALCCAAGVGEVADGLGDEVLEDQPLDVEDGVGHLGGGLGPPVGAPRCDVLPHGPLVVIRRHLLPDASELCPHPRQRLLSPGAREGVPGRHVALAFQDLGHGVEDEAAVEASGLGLVGGLAAASALLQDRVHGVGRVAVAVGRAEDVAYVSEILVRHVGPIAFASMIRRRRGRPLLLFPVVRHWICGPDCIKFRKYEAKQDPS